MFKSSRLFTSKLLKIVFDSTEQRLHREWYLTAQRQIMALHFMTAKNDQIRLSFCQKKSFHSNFTLRKRTKDEVEAFDEKRSLMYYNEFGRHKKKDKKSFLETIRLYKQNIGKRSGHVEFIKAALHHMKEFGVHRDLECYKKLVDVFPKGVYVATNRYLVMGTYFPRQQFVTIDLLMQMENNGVIPDIELGFMLRNIFGQRSLTCEMYKRMFYWAVKIKNKSPFILPRPLPSDALELAKLAIQRITSVDLQTEISIFQTAKVEESVDNTWIVSGQSPKQRNLLKKHPKDTPVIVEGGDLVWLREKSISYFVLRADGEPLPYKPPEDPDDISNLKSKFFNPYYDSSKEEIHTVHEQDDGIIYAVCATGTSSRDSLLSWIRILQNKGNPILADLPVLFRFKQPENLPAPFTDEIVKQEQG